MMFAGIVAGPLYVLVSLIEVASRDGFDPRRHAWSQLANGEGGWIHSATLITCGSTRRCSSPSGSPGRPPPWAVSRCPRAPR